MPKGCRLTTKIVKEYIESFGYKMTSEYKSCLSEIILVCNNNHSYQSTWNRFKSGGNRCPYCVRGVDVSTEVRKAVEAAGYQMKSEYKNLKSKISLVCNNGHEYKAAWGHFRNGARCPYCYGNKILPGRVKSFIESSGYQMTSDYKNSGSRLVLICPVGHSYKTTWNSFQRGNRCGSCSGLLITHEQVNAKVESAGYKLNSEYRRNNIKLSFTCPKQHNFDMIWNSFQTGSRCPHCFIPGFDQSKPAILYYVRFQNQGVSYYKIGVTNRTIQQRFLGEPMPYKIIKETQYLFGYLALSEEQSILKKYDRFKYKGDYFLKSGNTELFAKDVLKLDKFEEAKKWCQ